MERLPWLASSSADTRAANIAKHRNSGCIFLSLEDYLIVLVYSWQCNRSKILLKSQEINVSFQENQHQYFFLGGGRGNIYCLVHFHVVYCLNKNPLNFFARGFSFLHWGAYSITELFGLPRAEVYFGLHFAVLFVNAYPASVDSLPCHNLSPNFLQRLRAINPDWFHGPWVSMGEEFCQICSVHSKWLQYFFSLSYVSTFAEHIQLTRKSEQQESAGKIRRQTDRKMVRSSMQTG